MIPKHKQIDLTPLVLGVIILTVFIVTHIH
jgi:hypothetical protein